MARSSDTPHHLFFELKACVAMICGQGEMTEMAFSIYNKSLSKFVSEPYIVKLTYNGMPIDQENIGKLYTLFTELTSRDIGSQLFIVCRIVRIGKMLLNEKENNSSFDDSSKVIHYQSISTYVLALSAVS